MIKRMWAIFDKNRLISGAFSYIPKTNKEVKPVWVTDEDPFANVRKVYEELKYLDKLLSNNTTAPFSKVWNAIKKDMENFPPIGEAGDKAAG